jgi:hypothetical protein
MRLIARAGTIGRTVRVLVDQFTNVVKTKVPTIQQTLPQRYATQDWPPKFEPDKHARVSLEFDNDLLACFLAWSV